mgnify:CR=1 FL=1
MKRMVSLALVLALLTALFTGCKKQSTTSETKQSDTTEPTAASAQAVAYKAVSNPLPKPLDTVQAAVFTDSALFLADKRPAKFTATTNTSPHSTARTL